MLFTAVLQILYANEKILVYRIKNIVYIKLTFLNFFMKTIKKWKIVNFDLIKDLYSES